MIEQINKRYKQDMKYQSISHRQKLTVDRSCRKMSVIDPDVAYEKSVDQKAIIRKTGITRICI